MSAINLDDLEMPKLFRTLERSIPQSVLTVNEGLHPIRLPSHAAESESEDSSIARPKGSVVISNPKSPHEDDQTWKDKVHEGILMKDWFRVLSDFCCN